MRIGVFGTGMVGEALGTRLVELGHDVIMGSRTADNAKGAAWATRAGARASTGTFADAAAKSELVFNCTSGGASLEVVAQAGAANLEGKILIDVANPLDYSKGMPPTLLYTNDDSLGERLQNALPATKVVKTLNTVNCAVMVDPSRVPEEHAIFVCGNDDDAKARVRELLVAFGWRDIIDLGGITSARATEGLMPIWLRLYGLFKTADFNFKLVRKIP